MVFAFNFHPTASHFGYRIAAPPGKYRDRSWTATPRDYGGHGRLAPGAGALHAARERRPDRNVLSLYLPTRTAAGAGKAELTHR
ncbi:MAG: alpha amylase C-terminal domain-containing protein [Desulfobacterales bacterium]|nr:alpha amylase C-terminal domain-containing protein [Desulfobacterales bacterium]